MKATFSRELKSCVRHVANLPKRNTLYATAGWPLTFCRLCGNR